jgi:hypothetical protein
MGNAFKILALKLKGRNHLCVQGIYDNNIEKFLKERSCENVE